MSKEVAETIRIPEIFSPRKKTKTSKKTSANSQAQPQEGVSTLPYRIHPPQSSKASYCLHGVDIPDPYRPLECITTKRDHEKDKTEEEKHTLSWINYQKMHLDKYLDDENCKKKLMRTFQEDWMTIPLEYRSEIAAAGGRLIRQYPATVPFSTATYSFRFDEEDKAQFIKTCMASGEEHIYLDERDYWTFDPAIQFSEIFIHPKQHFCICRLEINVPLTKFWWKIIDPDNGQVIDEYKDMKHLYFEAFHPDRNGFYYKKDIKTKDQKREASALFYHEIGTDWDADPLILKLFDEDHSEKKVYLKINKYHISSRSLQLQVDETSKYENTETRYVIDPKQPEKLIKIPSPPNQKILSTETIGITEDSLYIAISHSFNKKSIVRLDLHNPDYKNAEMIFDHLLCHDDYNAFFSDDKFFIIETVKLGQVLKIYSKDKQLLYKFKNKNPAFVYFISYNDKLGILNFCTTDFVTPLTRYTLDTTTYKITKREIIKAPSWLKDVVVKRDFACSADGTKIPLTLIYRKDLPFDGSAPTILYGYGGFGLCLKPYYDPLKLFWVKQGGVFAIAHIRGDGGWTKGWPSLGSGKNKQNSFTDLNACAEHLIKTKITSAQKLTSMGASNGGLTVVAAMQQRPDLYGCVICQIPVLDMINLSMQQNVLFHHNFNENYGTVALPEDFQHILKYSPLHNIQQNGIYPPVLVMAMGEDRNAHPSHALKFVATMQDKAPDSPCYLYWKEKGGHGDIFTVNYGYTDFVTYTDMLYFIFKSVGHSTDILD